MSVKLKVCGVTRPEDLAACVELGVDAVGINLWAGSRRGLSLAEAEALLRAVDPPRSLERVGVFVEPSAEEVRRAAETLALDLVQIVGAQEVTGYGLPYLWVVRGTPALAELLPPAPRPARALLDAAVPGYGGAGQTTDWSWAAAAVRQLAGLEVWLAGGITPANAAAAIGQVRPAGLDVASGTELPGARRGEKDRAAIAALLVACRGERAGRAGSEGMS
ncbi:phosphoribosylanthranilate isomerase [Nannocystis exedens]|uniref:N-(5'-phosphoribosyl)anthranilate isomerase n=1 Tax=Nannocystis exedens TaxID=54 RepID=A0A1I2EDH7_9BACT|nr:phosphoribosylanthranilate isomerase [Nannocystis exedens]PCC74820.1 phosphoribosylanthranilate isomerase [Nannocystis exedens]SFE90290.1 phosphoribosylanthranilate isomerase [Nannocystis exedens]